MRNLKIMSAFVFLFTSLFFISCEKEPNELMQTNQKQDVVFGINHVLPDVLKSSEFDVECSDQEPVTAEIVIDGVTYNPNVFELDGELLTQAIKLNSGNYTVESFMLLDSNGDVVMATPAEGSDFAVYVDQTVTFDIITSEFDKTEVSIDVLCFNEAEYTSFGFNWFNVGQVEVFEIPFFGDLCYDPTSYEGSLYDQVFNLEDYPFDIPAIFEIRSFVDVDGQWESLKTFGNVVNGVLTTGPVMAEYFTHSDGAVDFKFELWIYVYTGQGNWDYVQFDEWEFDSNNPLTAESNGVVDFVVGDCLYNGTPAQYTYDPFEPIEFFLGCDVEVSTENVLNLFEEQVNAMNSLPNLFDVNNEVRVITGNDTEVFVEFAFEGAGWVNTFGYYTYELGNEPTDPTQLNKTVLWPQVSGNNEGGPLTPGDMLQIASSQLPENTVIGFYLVAKGYQNGQMVSGDYTHYTDFNLNENETQQHTLFLETGCNELILTFEDIKLPSGDKDFNDIIVRIKDNQGGFINQPNSFQTTNLPTL